MTILRFPETPRPGDRPSGPAEESRTADRTGAAPSPDARFLHSLAALNRPLIAAAMSRRPRAQAVLSAFSAEWTPPRLRAPRPANDTTTA
ncbi:hypothetical protein [Aureimonas sp. SK2]|uniref:hypothetical protein n=1 Tax=Aureimonas sp. SK2 TaxID=3015992 RepID=UPI002443E59E|nr:hypothetical protein [Aureimonas sp. SK2]